MSKSLPTITDKGRSEIDAILHDVIAEKALPAVWLGAANADEVFYENQAGPMDFDEPNGKQVDADTVIHLASMTKFVTCISCYQLVDRGVLTLDDPAIVANYLPELKDLEILDGYDGDKPILRKAKKQITLRMLMSHTAGMCYDWSTSDDRISKWRRQHNKRGLFKAESYDDYLHPLIYEPGTDWTYSVSIDWAGFLVERATDQSLEEYMQDNIFKPLSMTSTSFYPKPELVSRLFTPCRMDGSGKLSTMKPEETGKPQKVEDVKVLSGGGGLYTTARDYLKFLQAVLRSSPAYHTPPAKPLISTASFASCFTPILDTKTGIDHLVVMMRDQKYHHPMPNEDNVQHSAGLALYLEQDWGRKSVSGCWDGKWKTMFWLDQVEGVAGVWCTNVEATSNDNAIGKTFNAFEKAVYANLR